MAGGVAEGGEVLRLHGGPVSAVEAGIVETVAYAPPGGAAQKLVVFGNVEHGIDVEVDNALEDCGLVVDRPQEAPLVLWRAPALGDAALGGEAFGREVAGDCDLGGLGAVVKCERAGVGVEEGV